MGVESNQSQTRWVLLTSALAAGICFFLFSNHFLAPPDCASYWAWGASLAEQGDFDFSRVYERCEMPTFYVYLTPAGHISNDWPMGSGLALLPVIKFGPAAAHAWTALWAVVALMLWSRYARFGRKARAFGIACTLVGTPLLFYLLYGPFFSHPVSFAVSTAFLVAWDRTRQNRNLHEWLMLGLLLGFAALIRPQNLSLGIVLLAEIGFEVGRAQRSDRGAVLRDKLLPAALFIIGALLAFSPQLAGWKILYGDLLALPKMSEMHWFHPALGRTLLSDFHGIIPWTPLSLISTIGLLALAQRDGVLAAGLALALAAQIYLNAANEVWWSGGSFGNRRMADVAIIAAYGMAAFWEMKPTRGWKIAMAALGGLCCSWTLWLLLAERSGNLPLDRYVSFSGSEFWGRLMRVWTNPQNTILSLLSPLRAETTLVARAFSAIALTFGVLLFARILKRTPRGSNRLLADLLLVLAGFLLLLVFYISLRTELPGRDVTTQLGTKPGVLWDNYIELAQYEGDNGNAAAMETAARKAVAMRPNQYSGFWYLGLSLTLQHRWQESAAAFDEVLRLYPQHSRAAQMRDSALAHVAREVNP